MRSFFVLLGLGVVLLTIAIVVRSGKLMRENPGEPINAAMRQALADILGLASDRVSVKATTSERLGFTGREEGIAALATATLVAA